MKGLTYFIPYFSITSVMAIDFNQLLRALNNVATKNGFTISLTCSGGNTTWYLPDPLCVEVRVNFGGDPTILEEKLVFKQNIDRCYTRMIPFLGISPVEKTQDRPHGSLLYTFVDTIGKLRKEGPAETFIAAVLKSSMELLGKQLVPS